MHLNRSLGGRLYLYLFVIVIVILTGTLQKTLCTLAETYSLNLAKQKLAAGVRVDNVVGRWTVVDGAILDQGVDHIEDAFHWDPEHSLLWQMKAEIAAARGDFSMAVNDFEHAYLLNPENPVVAWRTGIMYENLYQVDPPFAFLGPASQERLQQLWLSAGVSPTQLIALGENARLRNQYAEARIWYGRAILLQPDYPDAWYYLGSIDTQLGEQDAAIQAWKSAADLYKKALHADRENRALWYGLGLTYSELGESNQAEAAYQSGITARGGQIGLSNLYNRLGRLMQYSMQPPDLERALGAYTQAIVLNEYSLGALDWQKVDTYYQRGGIYAAYEDWDDAVKDYQMAVLLRPTHYSFLTHLAEALWQSGKGEEAEATLLNAITLEPEEKKAYYLLADFYMQNGDFAEAKEICERVLELDPQDEIAQRVMESFDE